MTTSTGPFESVETIRDHVVQIVSYGVGFIDGEQWTGRALYARIEMLRAGFDTIDDYIAAMNGPAPDGR